jgi:DNA-binding NarL/FixJ family response regulator
MKEKHRVLVCDDSSLVRAGVQEFLKHEADIQVVGEASGGQAGIDTAVDLLPDLVLMDVSMPGVGGIEATQQIVGRAPTVKVIGYSTEMSWRIIHQMLEAGARGYVLKQGDPRELICAMRIVLSGGTFLSPRLMGTVAYHD